MYAECRHILPQGAKCKSPALKGAYYCFFHAKLHTYTHDARPKKQLLIPPLHDASGIQLALSQILGSLGTSRISRADARILLYGLQIALQTFAPDVPRTAPARTPSPARRALNPALAGKKTAPKGLTTPCPAFADGASTVCAKRREKEELREQQTIN